MVAELRYTIGLIVQVVNLSGNSPFQWDPGSRSIALIRSRWRRAFWHLGIYTFLTASFLSTALLIRSISAGEYSLGNFVDAWRTSFCLASLGTVALDWNTVCRHEEQLQLLNMTMRYLEPIVPHRSGSQPNSNPKLGLEVKVVLLIFLALSISCISISLINCQLHYLEALFPQVCQVQQLFWEGRPFASGGLLLLSSIAQLLVVMHFVGSLGIYGSEVVALAYALNTFKSMISTKGEGGEKWNAFRNYRCYLLLVNLCNSVNEQLPIILGGLVAYSVFSLYCILRLETNLLQTMIYVYGLVISLIINYTFFKKANEWGVRSLEFLAEGKRYMGSEWKKTLRALQAIQLRVGAIGYAQNDNLLILFDIIICQTADLLIMY